MTAHAVASCARVHAPPGILPIITRIPRGIVIVRPQQVAHSRQPFPSQDQPHGGLDPLDGATRARLRQRRWRAPSHDRSQHWLALVVVVLLHVLFVVAIWYAMRPRLAIVVTAPPEEALQIRFIARSHTAVAPPPPLQAASPPPEPHVQSRPHEPPAKGAMTLQLPTPTPVATARLYDEHGQPLLPAAAASAPEPGYVQRFPQGDTQIMQHTSPITYQATRFDDNWGKSSSVDQALQKLVDKTTIKKTIRLPRGVRIHCAISLAMLAGGCGGDPPAPPSAKDGDERLSMAPAASLDGQTHAPEKPDVESCIAMYRAGKPLAWGCPVDTPDRAVDAELRERAAGTNRAH